VRIYGCWCNIACERRAFDERQAHDYGEMLEPDLKLADTLLRQAVSFVDAIEVYLLVQAAAEL